MKITKSNYIVITVAICLTLAACGGSSSGGGGGGGGSTTISGDEVFPTDLVVASPFAAVSPPNIAVGHERNIASKSDDYISRKDELDAMLTATSTNSCTFNIGQLFLTQQGNANCYGPSLKYTRGSDPEASGMGGDSNIWDEYDQTTGNACAVAETNLLVSNVSGTVDTAVNLFASMVCIMNANETEMPAAGAAPLPVTTELQSVLSENGVTGVTIDSATLEHQANDSDGHSVYFFTLTGSATDSGITRGITLYLKHIPTNDSNTTYRGKLSFAYTSTDASRAGNCMDTNSVGSATTDSTVEAGSVLYEKTSATDLTYRLQKGIFCNADHMPLSSTNYDISPTDVATADNPTGYANGYNYYLFNMDPETGMGSFSFSWVAGGGVEQTRSLNITLGTLPSGGQGGCGYAGYSNEPLATPGSAIGVVGGIYCNWSIGDNHPTFQSTLVQRQCVKYNTASSLYETDEAQGLLAIAYAPTETCNASALDGFTYHSYDRTTPIATFSNDRWDDLSDIDNDLADKSEMSFDTPEVPEDVY